MTPEQVRAALELIAMAGAQASDRRNEDMSKYLDHTDRVLAQVAQLKAMNEDDGISALASQLVEAASGANPT